ncbi:tyrosine-type recombinase/integrase, partial [Teichococcus wenyumeiae]
RVAWPVAQWPAADREAWARAQRPGDFLEEAGAAATWRPATLRAVVGAYGRWLAFLDTEGTFDAAPAAASHITPDTVRRYVAVLRAQCAPVTRAGYIAWLCMMAQALAPERDWRWLNAVQARLQRQAEPVRQKRTRVVPAGELRQLGLDVMARAEALEAVRPNQPLAARDFRDGLMIALLAMRPLRQRNFLGIEIGRHLQPLGDGYVLVFAGSETKNHRPLEASVPASLVPALRRYLDHYRPRLLRLRGGRDPAQPLRPAGQHLWLSQCGMPFSMSAQWKALIRHTQPRFGHRVNAHLFRDCVATTMALEDPDHVRATAQLLGHAGFETTERYYIVAQAHQAQRQHHDVIAARRKALRRQERKLRVGST